MNYESIFNYLMYSNSNSNSFELSYDLRVTSFFPSLIHLRVTSLTTLVVRVIWEQRNTIIFKQGKPEEIFLLAQLRACLWLKHRVQSFM